MIRDAEFWMETRRQQGGGNALFTALLPLIHARYAALDHRLRLNRKHVTAEAASILVGAVAREPCEGDQAFRALDSSVLQQPEYESVVGVLQHIMMFAVPLYPLRYTVTGMSMSSKRSCIIDRDTKRLITFGSGRDVMVPSHIRCRGCVATEDFFAVLTDEDEVWASGGLKVLSYDKGSWTASPLGENTKMSAVAGKAQMIVGHGSRLACLTRALSVRPLSVLPNPVTSLLPFRQLHYLAMGHGDDYYMVGSDSVLYKTTASRRSLGTPRRVTPLSRTATSRVASGAGFHIVIDQSGQLYTFGSNSRGQLGYGLRSHMRRKPHLHQTLRQHFFVMAAAGSAHSLVLTSSGIVYGAGSNESGQLGLGEAVSEVSTFTRIPLKSKCVGVAAGPSGSMFACSDGCLYVCGSNDHCLLGLDADTLIVYTPTAVPTITSGVESYTMEFGTYKRPEILLRQRVSSPLQTPKLSARVTVNKPKPKSPRQTPNSNPALHFVPATGKKMPPSSEPVMVAAELNRLAPQKKKDGCVRCCALM
ncbi:putative Regulator of chromosome condensation (RCC1) repeat [Trypanosoma vivax]|uniref:Regulator of chromosome condensation n=1 Tax=Trypanosoma vivax (strain Y486) TaxID=1055687 RepID=G0TUF5_TRYVY|nr:hypothetical protein TRVL_01602 [Trypanosoma vivax]KAH8607411.1 putative Regulator of chromosome condensation (RCC1) repeat [Trypanosoma vivax]CCC47589.1 conserved hypothetical protein [Trypanosoma vivax Y486]